MKVDLSHLTESKPIGMPDEVIGRLQTLLGTEIPQDLRELLDQITGLKCEADLVFQFNEMDLVISSYFLTGEEMIDHLHEERLYGTAHTGIPIAHGVCGGTVYLRHRANFDVMFVDHGFNRSVAEPTVVASSLSDFLLGLQIDDTPISEEDLEGATVTFNPDFEKNIRELERQTGRKFLPSSDPFNERE
ncbi:MAG: SMI1/KNR4 family protein [Pseudomonadota bacterium]